MDTVTNEVFGLLQDISAPEGIRSISPKLVARELNKDPDRVFEALVALSDIGLLTQNILVDFAVFSPRPLRLIRLPIRSG